MIAVTLYTKDPCPLCDEVKEMLAALRPTFPHQLVEVDITADTELYMRYRYAIPVVSIGSEIGKAPISLQQLTGMFRRAGT